MLLHMVFKRYGLVYEALQLLHWNGLGFLDISGLDSSSINEALGTSFGNVCPLWATRICKLRALLLVKSASQESQLKVLVFVMPKDWFSAGLIGLSVFKCP